MKKTQYSLVRIWVRDVMYAESSECKKGCFDFYVPQNSVSKIKTNGIEYMFDEANKIYAHIPAFQILVVFEYTNFKDFSNKKDIIKANVPT